jgi:hypothetical protein
VALAATARVESLTQAGIPIADMQPADPVLDVCLYHEDLSPLATKICWKTQPLPDFQKELKALEDKGWVLVHDNTTKAIMQEPSPRKKKVYYCHYRGLMSELRDWMVPRFVEVGQTTEKIEGHIRSYVIGKPASDMGPLEMFAYNSDKIKEYLLSPPPQGRGYDIAEELSWAQMKALER